MPPRHKSLAIVYDFDGTLSPGNVQERQFLPDVGVKPNVFWKEVDELARDEQADKILMYMRLMLEKAEAEKVRVHLEDFRKQGEKVKFFDGIPEWFSRVNDYGRSVKIRVEHYVISSGNAEIIEGTSIASEFERIYASRFLFDHNKRAVWPAVAVNYTTKTQYLFRINKGAHDLSDDSKINKFIKPQDRDVPFERMIYIGDGLTDVPCFRLVKDQGGLSIAVFKPNTQNARENAERFVKDGRVHAVLPANYTKSSELDKVVKAYIGLAAAREEMRRTGSAL